MSDKQRMGLGKCLAFIFVFLWFAVGCVGHFVATSYFASIVPPYLSHPDALVYISGAFEFLGAVGILISVTRRAAGIGLFLLTIAVTPANVQMWLHPDLYPTVPECAYTLRLFIQVGLLACIWWSTQPSRQYAATNREPARSG